jgi:hypothetical protein
MKNDSLSSLGLKHIHRDFEHEGQILNKFKKFLSISQYNCAWFYVIWNPEMAPDRTILHLIEKIQAGGRPRPTPVQNYGVHTIKPQLHPWKLSVEEGQTM